MIQDKVTNTIAATAVASPWWLPSLANISETASALLPVAGVVWIVVQIIVKIIDTRRRQK